MLTKLFLLALAATTTPILGAPTTTKPHHARNDTAIAQVTTFTEPNCGGDVDEVLHFYGDNYCHHLEAQSARVDFVHSRVRLPVRMHDDIYCTSGWGMPIPEYYHDCYNAKGYHSIMAVTQQ